MRHSADIAAFIAGQPRMMQVLTAVESLDLTNAWVGAGFVRNAVWDALHGRAVDETWNDVDVVFFDPSTPTAARDAHHEERLRAGLGGIVWSVKNQARMHERNGDRPYRDVGDALAHWPETCTAVAARSVRGAVEILAPFGVEDLLAMRVRPTPAFARKLLMFHQRLRSKDWLARWPKVHVLAEVTPR